MTILSKTESHYVRCIKPNPFLEEDLFEKDSVLFQLKCSGIIEATKIRKSGYFYRATFDQFCAR